MKTTINPELPVELTIHPDFQSTPMVITGNYETVAPIAEQIQADDSRRGAVTRVSKRVGHSVLEAPKQAVEGFLGRLSVDVKAIAYDRMHGTTMYELRRQKLADARDVKFAASIGLLSLEETFCQKHKAAVDKLRA